jgi:hypothetical protein
MKTTDIRPGYRPPQAQHRQSFEVQVLAIALGVFIGVTGASVAFYHYWQWDVGRRFSALAAEADAAFERAQARLGREAELRADLRQQQQAALRQAQWTCDYWRREYQELPSSNNAAMRDRACSRVRALR